MKKFRFEIQNCIQVTIEGENAREARISLIDTLEEYGDEMVNSSYVSDGVELNENN